MRKIFSYKVIAALSIVVQLVTLLPILYCSMFNYATGDDLGYSAELHQVMVRHGTPSQALDVIRTAVVSSWYGYQGTWSSIVLFQLQPGIWGERAYVITAWLALACIFLGTGYFLHQVFVRRLGMSRAMYAIVLNTLLLIMIQFIPKIRGGLFWYTSVAHYIIPYLAATLSMGWSLHYLETGRVRFLFGCTLLMAYLGGAGYPLIVLAAAWLFFLSIGTLFGLTKDVSQEETPLHNRRRAILVFIPLAVEMAGFTVSAIAPGNKVRGGSDFGFGVDRVVNTILRAMLAGGKGIIGCLTLDRGLVSAMIIVILMLFYHNYDPKKSRLSLRHPFLVAIVCYIITCAVRMPAIYAGVEVSGGVPDTEFFTTMIMLFLTLFYVTASVKQIHCRGRESEGEHIFIGKLNTLIVMLSAVMLLMFGKYFVGNTADYLCLDYIRSGQLHDFENQMEERLEILTDESLTDVVLPEMNPEQGPIMHMALTNDPDNFTNRSTARYYGKNSVIAVPRTEYEQLKK